MKTMTVIEIDQHWDEAKKELKADKRIIVTRDGEVVGHLIPANVEAMEVPRKRFDPEEHRRWMKEMWGDETFDTLTPLMEDREDRNLISESALAALAALNDQDEQSPHDSKAGSER